MQVVGWFAVKGVGTFTVKDSDTPFAVKVGGIDTLRLSAGSFPGNPQTAHAHSARSETGLRLRVWVPLLLRAVTPLCG